MNSAGAAYYYLYDAQGSVGNVTSATGASEWTYAYDPFGAIRTQTRNDPNAPANPMQYSGQLLDAASGLYDLRARQYDPSTGRFLSQDPMADSGQTAGTYIYANDNPNTYSDPSGNCYRGIGSDGNGYSTGLQLQGTAQAVPRNGNITDGPVRWSYCRSVNNMYLTCIGNKGWAATRPCWNHVQNQLGKAIPDIWFSDTYQTMTVRQMVTNVVTDFYHMNAALVSSAYHHPLEFLIPGKLEYDAVVHFKQHPEQLIAVVAAVIDPALDGTVADMVAGAGDTVVTTSILGELSTPVAEAEAIGVAREVQVAVLTDGAVVREPFARDGVGPSEIDVKAGNGDYIAVGGPGKGSNPAKLGHQMSLLRWKAEQDHVGAQAYFELGTDENTLDIARRKLGWENVHVFRMP